MIKRSSDLTIEEYSEPVYYCRSCHSLCVLVDDPSEDHGDEWDGSYCGDCGSTDIAECMFGDWLKEQERLDEIKRRKEWRK